MGYYINPRISSKEKWLKENGTKLWDIPNVHCKDGSVVICLVNNGSFTAAAIAYNLEELKAFRDDPFDLREKQWWAVPIEKLTKEVCGVDMANIIK
jgi:hypothetical protein